MKYLIAACLITFCTLIPAAQTNLTVDYSFEQVPIGGGGYIIGMKIHPSDAKIRYFRTDIGGAYRWSETNQRLEQLIFYGEENADYYGVAGIALDPANPDLLILAVGRYCDKRQTAILVSNDRGTTWNKEIVPGDTGADIYFASNGGRGCQNNKDQDRQGSPIALNPLDANELYIGSRGTGLWKLDITTETFTSVASPVIPNNVHPNSIRNVVFHPTSPSKIFIAYAGQGIYRGDINTGLFSNLNSTEELKEVSDLSISKEGTYMLMACKRKGIYRATDLLSAAPVFEKVLSYTGADRPDDEAFLTVTCSPHHDDVAITVNSDWKGLNTFRVSQDSGKLNSWGNKLASTVSTNIYPWHTDGFGSHISQIAFSPDSPTGLYFTSWFSSYYTADYTSPVIQWTNEYALGHEEAVITDIVSWPVNDEGNFLGVTCGDQTGFVFNSIIKDDFPTDYLNDRMDNPNEMRKGASMDYAFNDPDHIVVNCVKEWDDKVDALNNIIENNKGAMFFSTDGAKTFTRSTQYDHNIGKSVVAVSSTDPNRVVIANRLGLQYSSDHGESYTPSAAVSSDTGVCTVGDRFGSDGMGHVSQSMINTAVFSTTRPIAADKVLGCVFYHYDMNDGTFHVSTDYGASFFHVSSGLPAYGTNRYKHKTRVNTVVGHARHVWINFNDRLLRSQDGGENWIQVADVQNATLMTIGKQMPTGNYPTVYLYGRANNDNLFGFYRSVDKGLTWQLIHDPAEREIWGSIKVLGADMNEAGQFYFGAAGLGLLYGRDATGDACDPSNLVENPSFESNYDGWQTRQSNGGQANFTIDNTEATEGQLSAQVLITNEGTNYWDVQIKQNLLSVKAGTNYRLSFSAKTSTGSAHMRYGSNTSIGNNFVMGGTAALTNHWATYHKQFTANSTEDIYLTFNFGDLLGEYHIDDVVLSEYCTCVDSDHDSICDDMDQCPGFDDTHDADGDGVPDGCDAHVSCELINNGDFSAGTYPWYLRSFSGASGQMSAINGAAHILINQTSNSNWHLGMRQDGILLEQGKHYELSLDAHAAANRQIDIIISDEAGAQYMYQQLILGTSPANYVIPFSMSAATDTRSLISINVATQDKDVYIDNVSLIDVACRGCSSYLSIMNQDIWPAEYQVTDVIESNGRVIKMESVGFKAKNIKLLPDFEVEQGATFDAINSPCQ